ncbi:ABC-type transport system permease protein (probable substrate copper) [Natronomonas pharaonis DSM 2160]|uniref:ABC-type transport system permease protein (Probable substrate copper) n=1 Tax=Natronomonas pharaonis (strain ATCC 35678 / DSM 2160 / CIP 103997 / JCM 8858 / NBRC 14720 / NCIMB 2260 / Gabara) TaxID=348780 RepID=A0A1U7EXX6_NATPD|nr:ABC transporter permease [Natronomonas pharaonis]CAI50051.1 ABC-type transport system permease protein (probable substrate copper) [Natronomonas pharaonis DSM 2160]
MSRHRAFGAVAWRELQTVVRTRTYALLSVGLAVVFVQLLRSGGGVEMGYVPAAVDLLLALELLVPLVAVALGYRAFTGDNDDLSVLRTYPVSRSSLVAGVFVGRFLGLAAIVGAPLLLVAGMVARAGGPTSRVFATHRGVDSPVLFIRFIALTLLFGAVVLAMAMAVSVIVRSGRAALVLALAVLVVVVAGGDLLALAGLSAGIIGDDMLASVLGASPNSAYRGLVLDLVVGVATDQAGAIAVPAAVAGLATWLGGSLLIVAAGLHRQPASRLRNAIRSAIERARTTIVGR